MDIDNWTGSEPLPMLFAKTADGAINTWQCWVEGPDVCVRWGQYKGAFQDARFTCLPKNEGRANATTAEEQAVKEAIAKHKKQLKKKYFPTMDSAETTLNLKPMLAKKFDEHLKKISYPVDVQPKLDGCRCLAYWKNGRVYLQSRGGDPYEVEHISETLSHFLPPGVLLDGELYIHGKALQDIMSLVKRPQEGSAALEYRVYDVLDNTEDTKAWYHRAASLRVFGLSLGGVPQVTCIQTVATYEAHTENGVRQFHDQFVQEGYEGAIIRKRDGVYKFGHRSDALLKLKSFQDDEFEIVDFAMGKGKFADMPIYKCVTKNGKFFDVVPRGTSEARRQMLLDAPSARGKQLTVRYFTLTNDGVPQFPIGWGIREKGD